MKPTPGEDEAFLSVVRHRGISHAAKAGCGDLSSLSKRIASLEARLGTTLFRRDEFHLYRHGRIYFEALERAEEVCDRALEDIWAETRPALQIAAAPVVAEHYLPGITRQLERQHANLRCSTEYGTEEQLRQMLRHGEVNLAIAPLQEGWRGFNHAILVDLRLVLICPVSWRIKSAAELWARQVITEPLFVSAAADTMTRSFNAGLKGLRVKWENRRRVATALCVTRQVAEGDGFGLTVDVPNLVGRAGLRVLPLAHFEPVPLAAFWRGKPTWAHDLALELLRGVAGQLQAGKGTAR